MAFQALPYVIHSPHRSLREETDTLSPSQGVFSLSRGLESHIAKPDHLFFAYRIPYLPDWITSPHLAADSNRERIRAVIERQAQLVASLGKQKGKRFSLRYLSHPDRREVEVNLVVKGFAKGGDGLQMGNRMAADIMALLTSVDLPTEPVNSRADLIRILIPWQRSYICEIRQHEEVVPLHAGDAYVTFPFSPTSTTWIDVFETILRQRFPCLVSIYLEPTRLFEEERRFFANASSLAESLSDRMYHPPMGTFEWHVRDPQARMVAQLYADYLRRFQDPVLVVVQIASPDSATAHAVSQVLSAAIAQNQMILGSATDERQPNAVDVLAPSDTNESALAHRTLQDLELTTWGGLEVRAEQERLRYLVDAKDAVAAFRFPIGVRGGVPGIKTRQSPPNYDTGPRQSQAKPGEVLVGRFVDRGGAVCLPAALLSRHVLVAGTSGSGKTTTCMQILSQLWQNGVPFLVIEPTKTEYRTLLESPLGQQLRIFTLGDETTSAFRLNPLEILPGVRVESHISYLRVCLEAALPSFGILPSLIEESLHTVYLNRGWSLTDRGSVQENRAMPTLGELYFEIVRAAEGRGWTEKTTQDIRAAAAGRIGSLLRGSKGRMLNTQRSFPFSLVMSQPTVLELNSLNDDEKALVMLFLLTSLREYCQTTRQGATLEHVTLIEEAHRLMTATPHVADRETSADTQAQAVGMVSDALSEMRGLGEGFIIAEQIPSRLVDDALKNTTTKVVHRLPGEDDRQAIGATMNMDDEQERYLAKLSSGQAALFTEGYEKATFISVVNYRADHGLPDRVTDSQVESHMMKQESPDRKFALLPFAGCQHCLKQCQFRDRVMPVAYDVSSRSHFQKALMVFQAKKGEGYEAAAWRELAKACRSALDSANLHDEHASYCYFVHLWHYPLTRETAERFREMASESGVK
jgi:hypothetical protein